MKKIAGSCILMMLYLMIVVPCIYKFVTEVNSGTYYVERINASTNLYDTEAYIHLWAFDTAVGGRLYQYSLENRTAEDLTGKDYIWDIYIEGGMLYYSREDGYWCLDLGTRKQWQIAGTDEKYAQLAEYFDPEEEGIPYDYEDIYTRISDALCQWDDSFWYVEILPQYLDQTGAEMIGIAQMPKGWRYRGDRLRQNALRCDVLFSYDPATEACEILYQPKNNKTRIIGYEDGVIYLFEKYTIYRQVMKTGEREALAALPKSKTYTFDWWKNYLLVLDHGKNELVEVLKI